MQVLKRISVSPVCYLVVAIGLLLIPVRWMAAWVLAVTVHEVSHCLAIWITGCPIYAIRISLGGAEIQTGYMGAWSELFCTLAGPLGAMVLLIFARYIPFTAVCVLIQSIFNLLPIYPFDGGRIVQCLTEKIFGIVISVKILSIIRYVTYIAMTACAIWLALQFDLGIIPILLCALIILRTDIRKRPCKLPIRYSTMKQNKRNL